MVLDSTHLAIIRELREGRKPFKQIADKLAVSENTVRSRVTKLREAGVLDISGVVNPDTIPGHRIIMMGIKLSGMNLVEKGEELSRLKGVISVGVVTGRYDLIVTVLTTDDENGLLEFFTEQLDKVEGVLSTETFVVYKGYNTLVPYTL